MPQKNYFPTRRNISTHSDVESLSRQTSLRQRRELLLSLRQAGASYSEIVRAKIGYNSTAQVARDMKVVLERFKYETPEDVLVLDLARLDELQKLLTAAFRTGDLAQAGPIMRVMQFRRETLGITQEQIAERQMSKTQIANNGIMVIQGSSTGDYVAAMAAAAGVSTQEVKTELERISASNRIQDAEIVDSEVTDQGEQFTSAVSRKKKVKLTKSFQKRLLESAARFDDRDTQNDIQPVVDPSTALLSVDLLPADLSTYAVPIKDYDHNVNPHSGISYKAAPRKVTSEESKTLITRNLKGKKNAENNVDQLEKNTISEQI